MKVKVYPPIITPNTDDIVGRKIYALTGIWTRAESVRVGHANHLNTCNNSKLNRN